MQPQTKETLSAAGININDGLERFMGNEALLTRFLKRFLEDSNYRTLLHAVSAGDQKIFGAGGQQPPAQRLSP